MNKIKTNIVTKLLLCVMLLCTLCGALFLGAGKDVSASAEATTVEYKDLLGLENRDWGAHEGEYYFGGVTLEPFGWFNTAASASGTWYVGNNDVIAGNNGCDILQYIYVNGVQARQVITDNANGDRLSLPCEGCWMSNPATYPIYVETTGGSGIMIRIATAWAGESLTITFKAGFSLIRNDDAVISLSKDVAYKFENNTLTRLVLPDEYTVTFEGTDVVKTVVEGEAIGTLPAVPAKEGYQAIGWAINGEQISEATIITASATATPVYKKEAVRVNYNDLLGLEDRTSWAAHEGEYCFGGVTLEPFGYFNTAASVSNTWYVGNNDIIAANNGCDIMEYIYVNGQQARKLITDNANGDRVGNDCGCWLSNPAACPVYVETTGGSGIIIKILKSWAGESLTITFKAGFSLIRNDDAVIYLTEDVNYKYENDTLTKVIPAKEYTVTFQGTDVVKTVVEGEAIGTLPAVPAKEGYVATGWEINGEQISEATIITANATAIPVYVKEVVRVNYNDLLGLENRTSWGAHEGEYYFGGVTLEPFGWFNTAASASGAWYVGNNDVIAGNNGCDIMQYIYVNGVQARQAISDNAAGNRDRNGCGCWLSNPAAYPVYVETTGGDGLIIRIAKVWAGESLTITFKAGFSLIRNDDVVIYLTEDVNYKYENDTLTKVIPVTEYTVTFQGTDVVKTVVEGEAIGELPEVPAKEGYVATGWEINGEKISASTIITGDATAVPVYVKEVVRVEYSDLFGIENRTSWGAHEGEYYFGGVTLDPFGYFNTDASINGAWYVGNKDIIAANNACDIMEYIYVNGVQARQAITDNANGNRDRNGCGCWLSNPAAYPVYVETTGDSGIIIRIAKVWAGESFTITFKAGFSLIRNDGVVIYLAEDVNYKYENDTLTRVVPVKECTVTFQGTDVVKTVLAGEAIGELPEVPAKEGYVATGWEINGEKISASTIITDDVTAVPVYVKEIVREEYSALFGIENRTSWGAHEGEYYFGGVTVDPLSYFNTDASIKGAWYAGNNDIIAANNGCDILQYIYVNGVQARQAIIDNKNGDRLSNTCGCWMSNPAAYPVYVETTTDSGIIIKVATAWAGESLTISFKAGFSLIRNDGVVIYLAEDVDYAYTNGKLNRLGKECTVTFEGTDVVKTLRKGDVIGTLPAIPERAGAVGVWMIDGEILTEKTVYAYDESKTVTLYYYEGTDISGTIDMMDWGSVTGPDTTYLRVGNYTDENGNLFMSTAFKNVHWQDHASTAAENYGCDLMEYIYINGQSARAISTQNGIDRKYGGSDDQAFPFSYGGVFAPIDVVTDSDSFAIIIMNEYIEAEGLVVVLKAGFRIKTADGGMLYLSEDFVYPYYKVSFGEELTVKVGYGETVAEPSFVPTKAETEAYTYTFKGWYLGETEWDFTTVVTQSITLTAAFTAVEKEKFEVTFNPANGEDTTVASVYVGSYLKAEQIPANPAKGGEVGVVYTFLYWSLDGETAYDFNTAVTEAITLTAVYTTKPVYQVTMGETVVNVVEGGKVEQPADPTKESSVEFDYTFEGWYLGETKWDFENNTVTENITLTAKYTETKRKYTITFNVTGNDAVTFAPVVVEYGETYDLSNLLDGVDLSKHTCAITSGGVAVTSVTVLSDVTVDVTFKARVYFTVTINGVEYQIELGEKLQQPTDPTKDSSAEFDYIFDGWYNGDEKWDFAKDTVSGALNLVAKYKQTKRKYTISFNVLGNDKISLGAVEVEYGQIFDLSKVLEGLDISGYTYSFTIGGLEKINFKVVENVTVDVSFRQLVENAKDKGNSLLDKWESAKDYVNNLQGQMGCSSGIGSGVASIAFAAVVAFALKKKKDE